MIYVLNFGIDLIFLMFLDNEFHNKAHTLIELLSVIPRKADLMSSAKLTSSSVREGDIIWNSFLPRTQDICL